MKLFLLWQRADIPDEIAKVERALRQEIKRRQTIERKLQRLLEVRHYCLFRVEGVAPCSVMCDDEYMSTNFSEQINGL